MGLALDGSGSNNNGSGSTVAISGFSTANASDLIVVDIVANAGPITGIAASGGNSAGNIGSFTAHATAGSGQVTTRWSAVATAALSNITITVTQTGVDFITATAYGISGASTSSPWDSGGPQTSTASPADPLSIMTHNTNTMVIACYRMGTTGTPTAGSGYTSISTFSNGFMLSEYQVETATGTYSPSITTGLHDSTGAVVDAVIAAAATTFDMGSRNVMVGA